MFGIFQWKLTKMKKKGKGKAGPHQFSLPAILQFVYKIKILDRENETE